MIRNCKMLAGLITSAITCYDYYYKVDVNLDGSSITITYYDYANVAPLVQEFEITTANCYASYKFFYKDFLSVVETLWNMNDITFPVLDKLLTTYHDISKVSSVGF